MRTGICVLPLLIAGCVMQSKYNAMLQQQEALEASLRTEINADQVKIEQLENGIRVTMSDELLYRSGSVELHPNGRAALNKVTGQLANMAAQGNQIDVVGNTDNVPIGPELAGRYPTNWELAGARAAVVVRYLQENGVDPTKLEAISNGQYHPVASNDTAAGRAQNRRTDLLIRPH
ncbi:MAG TPA: OmpA family protein [Candidatus Margulisiibacteriota bacterium]|nr:OmpA family protein [Candidatus Margulisiibacteriota bacterium]